MTYRLTYCLLLLILGVSANAQDLHYSMFDFTLQNLNPATVGQFDGNYRFAGNHRHQWKAVTVPYTTYSVAADAKDILQKKGFNGGFQINQDRAGDSRFNTFQVNLSAGYSKAMNKDSSLIISGGVQTGITHRNIDYTDLRFDDQYNGWRYDNGLPNNESFQRESRWYGNFASGVYAQYKIDDEKSFNLGVSLYNMTKPKQSFFNDDDITLDARWNVHGSADIYLNPKLDILPGFQLMGQGKYKELDIGTKFRYTLVDMRGAYRAVYLGSYYRNKDAAYVVGGLDYDNWKFGMSYDINFSTLVPASNGRGAFELAVIYILKIYNPKQIQRRICRDIM